MQNEKNVPAQPDTKKGPFLRAKKRYPTLILSKMGIACLPEMEAAVDAGEITQFTVEELDVIGLSNGSAGEYKEIKSKRDKRLFCADLLVSKGIRVEKLCQLCLDCRPIRLPCSHELLCAPCCKGQGPKCPICQKHFVDLCIVTKVEPAMDAAESDEHVDKVDQRGLRSKKTGIKVISQDQVQLLDDLELSYFSCVEVNKILCKNWLLENGQEVSLEHGILILRMFLWSRTDPPCRGCGHRRKKYKLHQCGHSGFCLECVKDGCRVPGCQTRDITVSGFAEVTHGVVRVV